MCVWDRFADKIAHHPGGCWDWMGARSTGGRRGAEEKLVYGTFRDPDNGPLRAHVWIAWQFGLIEGPRVPKGYQLDHLCENSLCVSPWHLELVPRIVNYDRRFNRPVAVARAAAIRPL